MIKINIKTKEKVKKNIGLLVSGMIKYFKCSEEDVKISGVKFDAHNFAATIAYNYIDWNRSSLRGFLYATCYFEITGEYELKGTFKYEDYFYKYDNLSPFLTVISKEIEELKNK